MLLRFLRVPGSTFCRSYNNSTLNSQPYIPSGHQPRGEQPFKRHGSPASFSKPYTAKDNGFSGYSKPYTAKDNGFSGYSKPYTAKDNGFSGYSSRPKQELAARPVSQPVHSVAPFCVFTSDAMLMLKPVPALVGQKDGSQGYSKVLREGHIAGVFMRKGADQGYDKESKISVELKAREIGEILTLRTRTPSGSISTDVQSFRMSAKVPAGQMTVNVAGSADGDFVWRFAREGDEALVVTLREGEMRCMQIMLESVLPGLYGWQTLNTGEAQFSPPKQEAPPLKKPETLPAPTFDWEQPSEEPKSMVGQ